MDGFSTFEDARSSSARHNGRETELKLYRADHNRNTFWKGNKMEKNKIRGPKEFQGERVIGGGNRERKW